MIDDPTVALYKALDESNIEKIQELFLAHAFSNDVIKRTFKFTMIGFSCSRSFNDLKGMETFEKVACLLIAKHTNINEPDEYGSTLLHEVAIWNPGLTVANALFAAGAKVIADQNGRTPIFHALNCLKTRPAMLASYLDLMELLLKQGTDIYSKNADGLSCIDLARNHPQAKVLALFKQHIEFNLGVAIDCLRRAWGLPDELVSLIIGNLLPHEELPKEEMSVVRSFTIANKFDQLRQAKKIESGSQLGKRKCWEREEGGSKRLRRCD